MEKIPILICVDSEPNRRLVDPERRQDWTGFEKTYEFFKELRPRLQDATQSPVPFSWFLRMDPQIVHVYGSADWVIQRYRKILDQLELDGDDFGLHAHPWRWDDSSDNWVADFGDQRWVNHCVELSFRTFQESFGRGCHSFSFGDHWMNETTLDLLEGLGVRFDVSTQPGLKRTHLEESHTGSFPDYTHMPRYPYRPSRTDFTRPGKEEKRGLWVIPLSTGSTDWAFTTLDPSAEKASLVAKLRRRAYEGCHDTTDCKWIIGWVWDEKRPNTPLNVEILDGDVVLDTLTAHSFRQDLLTAGKGNGKHGFRYLIPDSLRDGKQHSIRIKVANSSFSLSSSPQQVSCFGHVRRGDIDMAMFLNNEPFLFSKVMDKLLTESDNPYLAFVARSDIGIKPAEKLNVSRNFESIMNHPLADRFVFETPSGLIQRISQTRVSKVSST
jgi:hypothetical protein